MASPQSNPSPYLRANLWSRFFHSWAKEILTKGDEKGTIDMTDLYDVPSHLESTKLTDQMEANWFDEIKRSPQNPSLIRATLKTMGWKTLCIGLLLIPMSLCSIIQPLILTFLMNFFEPCSTMSTWEAWLWVAATVLLAGCLSLFTHENVYRTLTHAVTMRIAYSGLIYRKVLRLSGHALNTYSSGKITNLLSNDASQIEFLLYFINYLWKTPLEIALVIIFYWKFVRYIMFVAIGYSVVLLLVQTFCSRLLLYFRTKILQITDERVGIMSEIIKSMRIVKMYCWESAFSKKVRSVRKREINQCAYRLLLDGVQTLLSHTCINVTLLLMFTIMWSLDLRFDTKFFAVSMCMANHLRANVVHQFTIAIRNLVHYMAARKRIQDFLLLEESERDNRLLSTSYLDLSTMHNEIGKERRPGLVCNINQALWEKNEIFSLKNIQFNAYPGDLICIIGPVGSGKSSLLQTLSGEITCFDGKVRLYGSFCYVPQESWIFSSTIKNNILFGKDYDQKLFQKVLHACALESDIVQWSHGANTLVGDQGVMLSGGQKARVNMARALYRDADIYLMDDPLSAVDVKVSKHLFEKSIKKYLGNKICILATHQIQFLQDAKTIIVLNNGTVTHMGSYEELTGSSQSFNHLLGDIHQHDIQRQQSNIDLNNTETIEERKETLSSVEHEETKQEGTVKLNVYTGYLRAGSGLIFGVISIAGIFIIRELIALFSDRWLARWSNDETYRYQFFNNCTSTSTDPIKLMNESDWNHYRNHRFYVYGGSVFVLFVVTFIRVVTIEFICLNAGRVLHNKMFQRFVRAPILFFDINPIGRMSNRFTKDVAVMDDFLPMNLFELFQCLFRVLGTIVLVGWLNPWSFIPAIISVAAMVYIRHRYAQCLRDLKRLEGITRSPVYSYLGSTIHGLKVIRSYHTEQMCSKEFLFHLNENSRVIYLLLTVNRWAAIRFDWITVFFIAFVTVLAMAVRILQNQLSAADIALMLTYSLHLMGLLQWTIRLSVDVESHMTAVERVLEYCSLEQEPPAQVPSNRRPPSTWPSQGRIVFDDVSMSHSSGRDAALALHHISMTIASGEKVGVVGRTGAGKSSLIQTLFRMGNLVTGQIKIDDIDIVSIGLDDVRSRISIIPQDPVLFTGTMRNNLDPFDEYSDADIWIALEQVQLKTLVTERMPDGLQSKVTESGSNLSVGQKQLVCLARMILKKSKILVIDEATANVDNTTDELIQKTIREKFRDCTVLTIAHRLRTVIDSDRILVLGSGRILEFDTPSVLLSNPSSHFTSLVEQTGSAEAEHLRSLAGGISPPTEEIKHEESIAVDEDGTEEPNEDDPLLPSDLKIQ